MYEAATAARMINVTPHELFLLVKAELSGRCATIVF
jgi:hypothetical protein